MAQSLPKELLSAYAELEAAIWAAKWLLASPSFHSAHVHFYNDNMDIIIVAQLGGTKGAPQVSKIMLDCILQILA
eukprot:796620-Pyramimonas_sp.AAC.1